MSPTKIAEAAAQDGVVSVYRDAMGYPRLRQPGERDAGSAFIVIVCAVGILTGLAFAVAGGL